MKGEKGVLLCVIMFKCCNGEVLESESDVSSWRSDRLLCVLSAVALIFIYAEVRLRDTSLIIA